MSVLLTLIAHASTRAIREAAFPLDEPLDPSGLAKARSLAAEVGRVDSAWSSPALRARQTASALNLNAVLDPALRDLDVGTWAGRSFDEITAANPEGVATWTNDCSAAPHGGESILALLDRTARWLERLARDERRIVAVTHAAVIRAAMVFVLDANPVSFWRIDVPPLCQVRLRAAGGRWSLLCMKV